MLDGAFWRCLFFSESLLVFHISPISLDLRTYYFKGTFKDSSQHGFRDLLSEKHGNGCASKSELEFANFLERGWVVLTRLSMRLRAV